MKVVFDNYLSAKPNGKVWEGAVISSGFEQAFCSVFVFRSTVVLPRKVTSFWVSKAVLELSFVQGTEPFLGESRGTGGGSVFVWGGG